MTLAVPFVRLGLQQDSMKRDVLAAVERVLASGQFILGAEVERSEDAFAARCGARFAIGMDNGTSALIQALRVLAIGVGDEVITAPNPFVASAAAIALVGARPVFVDVGDDLDLDPVLIEAAVTPRTRAIMPVHLTGRPAAMDRIVPIAARHRLHVVEDAAQAIGASLSGTPVGAFGVIGCFSLHPLKNLAAYGDAGIVTTSDDSVDGWCRAARSV